MEVLKVKAPLQPKGTYQDLINFPLDGTLSMSLEELNPHTQIKHLDWNMEDKSQIPIGGRLQFFLHNWRLLTHDPVILNIVQGYKLEFTEMPEQSHRVPALKFGQDQTTIVEAEVEDLIAKGAVKLVNPSQVKFWSQIFLREKKGGLPTSLQPPPAEPICALRALQDGKHGDVAIIDSERRLDDQSRPEGCILLHPNSSRTPQVPGVLVARQSLSISSVPFWPGISTQSFHENAETSYSFPAEARYPDANLSGRLSDFESEPREIEARQGHCTVGATTIRLCDKLEKVSSSPDSEFGISGLSSKLSGHDAEFTGRQDFRYCEQMSEVVENRDNFSERVSKADRQANFICSSSTVSSVVLPETSDEENKGIVSRGSILREQSSTISRVQSGIALVGGGITELQWQSDSNSSPRYDNHERCLEVRMGRSSGRSDQPGTMVAGGVTAAHQHFGDESCGICSESIHSRETEYSLSSETGQQILCCSDKQNGGNKITTIVRSSEFSMELLSAERDHPYCRTSARGDEHNSRSTIKSVHRLEQLAVEDRVFPGDQQSLGAAGNRSLRRPPERTAGEICQLETRSRSSSGGLILNELARPEGIRFSSILPDRQMFGQNQEREMHDGYDNSDLASPDMVSTTIEHGNRLPCSTSTSSTIADVTERGATSPDSTGNAAIGSLENIGGQQVSQQISEAAQELITNARRGGTRKTYSYAWEKWASWCSVREIDPVRASLEAVINFLTELFETGLEYSTLNGYRSAISAHHNGIRGVKVGQHPQVCALLKGMFNQKPPQPKYMETWDVNVVLNMFRSWPDNCGLDLKKLSLKVTMLMALTGAMRRSELHLLRIDQMLDLGNKIQFHIGGLTKTRRVGQGPVVVDFDMYAQEPILDVVLCIRAYWARSFHVRGNEKQLLISFVKPHKAIATCSVARWLQIVMKEAGIDTDKYKAHSTRSASVSKARAMGLSAQEIMARANWAREATFQRFYCRRTGITFQQAVLDQ